MHIQNRVSVLRTLSALVFAFALFGAATPATHAQDAVVEVSPLVAIPLGAPADLFTTGFGGRLQGTMTIGATPIAGFAAVDYTLLLLESAAGTVNLVRLGGGAAYNLLSAGPLTIGAYAGAGVYLALSDSGTLVNPYASGGLRLSVDIGDAFQITASPAYTYEFAMRDGSLTSFFSGLDIGLSLGLVPARLAGSQRARIEITPPVFRTFLPVIYKYYDTVPFGSLSIINKESQTIHDVRVEFMVPQYMSSPQLLAEIDEMRPDDEIGVEVTALLSNSVLSITAADSVQSQVIVTYELGGNAMTAQRSATLRIQDRNTISWDDDYRAAAFITPRDPTILRLSRNVTTAARETGEVALNRNFRDAVALFYAMSEHGIQYQIDPESSYADLSQDAGAMDYVQFPSQTLDYRAGDCDDLSILYCAMLESVGVDAALITVPGHIYTAFSLGMSEEEAQLTFTTIDDLIYVNDQVWVPIEITLVNDGFVQAWSTGANEWRDAESRGVAALFTVQEAQRIYEATWFESDALDIDLPSSADVARAFQAGLRQVIARELTPVVRDLEDRLSERPSSRLQNRLGTVYARFGLYDEAREEFEVAARDDYVPAIVNLGNLAYIDGDLEAASAYYERADRLEPDNPEVLVGLARVQFELGHYQEAREAFELARAIDPEGTAAFSYISGGDTEASRASNAQNRDVMNWAE